MPDVQQITVLGTGLMGAPMAKNLLSSGYAVHVWNRTPAKAEALVTDGAKSFQDAKDAVAGSDIIITMLSDGQAVHDLLFDQNVARGMKPGACVVDMSSIKPAEAKAHALKLEEYQVSHLDAPVSGGTKGAQDATLAIMVGGDQAVFDHASPVLSAMGRPVRVGPSGAGQLSKLANQVIVAVTIGVVAEAMLLAEEGGADPAAIRQALSGGFADSIILQQHGARMTTGDFEPGGLSRLQLKDINNALEEAQKVGLKLPLAEQVQMRFKRLCNELSGSELDHSALYLELRNHNDMPTDALDG